MKKILIVITLFTLIGCVNDIKKVFGIRKFKKGDCLIQSIYSPELWHKPQFKVIAVGKSSYLTVHLTRGYLHEVRFGHMDEYFYQKIECRKNR